MKTKTKKSPLVFSTGDRDSDTDPGPAAPAISAESGYSPGSNISIPLKEDGSIDLERMRDKTKGKLKAALQSTPGLNESAPTATVEQVYIFPPQAIHAMYAATGMLEAVLAVRFFKVPEPLAKATFAYTAQELAVLTPPTERVLTKYASEWMLKYKDEIALATLLTSITISKINAVMMASRMYPASQPKSEPEPEKGEGVSNPQPN